MSRRRNAARRNFIQMTLDSFNDEIPLAFFTNVAPKPKRQRRATPRKAAKKTVPLAPAAPLAAAATSSDIITIDDVPETQDIIRNVNSKIGDFMTTGGFISSDEEETEMIRTKSNKKPSCEFFISDDSDNEVTVVKTPLPKSSSLELLQPSTSAGTSKESPKPHLNSTSDDIMDFVDSVLGEASNDNENNDSNLKNMKSLEDFRKETEEMLKNASLLLNEFKTGIKPQPEPSKELEESPSKKITINSCPICLESLANRQVSVTVCGHIFCEECITTTAKVQKKCPTCRKPINTKKIHRVYF